MTRSTAARSSDPQRGLESSVQTVDLRGPRGLLRPPASVIAAFTARRSFGSSTRFTRPSASSRSTSCVMFDFTQLELGRQIAQGERPSGVDQLAEDRELWHRQPDPGKRCLDSILERVGSVQQRKDVAPGLGGPCRLVHIPIIHVCMIVRTPISVKGSSSLALRAQTRLRPDTPKGPRHCRGPLRTASA